MASTASVPLFRYQRGPANQIVAVPTYDGLTAFAPFWGAAAFFSVIGDPQGLIGREGLIYALLCWASLACSALLVLVPRRTGVLVGLAAVTVALYLVRLPVASNNKTITTVFDFCLLASAGWLAFRTKRIDRVEFYELLRIPARLLLAIMYFYGIFHKINTDFLDPTVSCAVGLYKPLASPFGLEDNLIGRYLAIWSTFVIEGIAIVALFWRRWFAVGLLIALVFHYIIPISAYSWYMDFSSLVFALYMLSMPREASAQIYTIVYTHLVHPLRHMLGRVGVLAPAIVVIGVAGGVVLALALAIPGRPALMLLHSIFILVWAVVGGAAMTVMAYAAVQHLPYNVTNAPAAPRWPYIIPGLFFLSCLSPYVGLKTESSINMFSNLHTEGGTSNHLLMPEPPYLFDYQRNVVRVVDSSSAALRKTGERGLYNVQFTIDEYLRRHPEAWVSYTRNGQLFERVTAADLTSRPASWIERKLLIFKHVDMERPKVCTH